MIIIRRILTALVMLAVVSGLTTSITATPATAAESQSATVQVTPKSSNQAVMGDQTINAAGTEAIFTSSFNGTLQTEAQATGVAVAGANAMGKTILEDEKTNSPFAAIRNFKRPSFDAVKKNATTINSNQEGQKVAAAEVAKYEKVLNKSKVKIAKLKLRIKHKDGNVPKLKKQLKRAKKHLVVVRTSPVYVPTLKVPAGVCVLHSGRNVTKDLEKFEYCPGRYNDVAEIYIMWVPEVGAFITVYVVLEDGTILVGCSNLTWFIIPPGTPDETLFLLVRSFVGLKLDVSVAGAIKGRLTVYGEMKQNGETCDKKEDFEDVNVIVPIKTVSVSASDAASAIAFGVEQVRADVKAMADAVASVQSSTQLSVSKTLTLFCADVTPKPIFIGIDVINDVLVNNQVFIEDIEGSVAPGHTAQLVCSALNGSTIIAGNRQTVSGNFTAQPMTLRAPDEQPPANTQYNIPAKYDRVKCDLIQDDGQTAAPAFSNDFLIKVMRPDPALVPTS